MRANQARHRVRTMCRLLGVSPSRCYAWFIPLQSEPARRDALPMEKIRGAHKASKGDHGVPGMYAEVIVGGIRVGRKRIARLTRQAGLQGVSRRRWVKTTGRRVDARPAPDLVERNFTSEGPDKLWVADITYVPTQAEARTAIFDRIEGWYSPH